MTKGNAILLGGALGLGLYFWQHNRRAPTAAPPTTAPPFRGLASLHEVAALTRNAKASRVHGDLVNVVAHHRSWPGTSLRRR